MKKILITHTDLDGTGCAIVFKKKYPDISIEFRNYDTINTRAEELYNEKEEYDKIFFADIVPTDKEIGSKIINDDKFVLIDHHITQDYLIGKRTYNIDFCGAYLSAIYLFGNIEENYDLEKTSLTQKEKNFIYSIDA
jgi:oligoribonuclease NrnB/cAMP/cGMP phosphodiesterase (DHH superfamily)